MANIKALEGYIKIKKCVRSNVTRARLIIKQSREKINEYNISNKDNVKIND